MRIKKIIITGPESSGKTTLTRALAAHFQTVWAPEFARTYLERLGRPYEEADLVEIARGQLACEQEYAAQASGWLFCDTSLEVIKIWSEYKYGRCHPFILEALARQTGDLYLLCQPDLPWVFDPLRENPGDREELLMLYRTELQVRGCLFAEVEGTGEMRLRKALELLRVMTARDDAGFRSG